MAVKKTFFNWSSGKDSAIALHYLLQDESYSIECLLTSISKELQRVTMHGLQKELLVKQLESIDIPYKLLELPESPSHKVYNKLMNEKINYFKGNGYSHSAFGDIFLEDLREYREAQFKSSGIKAVFPLWKKDTRLLLEEFFSLGFKAIVICVDGQKLDKSFVGRELDQSFLADLPENVDPCGENGEFHTFCYDGPIFKNPISFEVGGKVDRTYESNGNSFVFYFCELTTV